MEYGVVIVVEMIVPLRDFNSVPGFFLRCGERSIV